MRTLDEALDVFAYHPATSDTAMKHAAVREAYSDFVRHVWPVIPDGPEKTLALRKLQESLFYANTAIALTAPADTSETRSVARVLPDQPKDDQPEIVLHVTPGNALAAEQVAHHMRRALAERAERGVR